MQCFEPSSRRCRRRPPQCTLRKPSTSARSTCPRSSTRSPCSKAASLNVARMSEWIVNDIKSHSSNADREASAAEKARRKLDREEAGKKGPCNVCKGDHPWWKCDKSPCTKCGKKWCQAVRGMVCFKTLDTVPEYLDAQGKPLNPKLQEEMNKIRKEAGKPTAEVSAAELASDERDCSTDDENDACSTVGPIHLDLTSPALKHAEASGLELAAPSSPMLIQEMQVQPMQEQLSRPSHYHIWRWGVCPIHDIDSCSFHCDECDATYCDMCNDGPRPSYGPWKPGPVDSTRHSAPSEASGLELIDSHDPSRSKCRAQQISRCSKSTPAPTSCYSSQARLCTMQARQRLTPRPSSRSRPTA